MNNHEIENLLHHLLGDLFCGVWACDQLPLLTHTFPGPAYFIVNTHPSHMPGEHWLAMTLDENGQASFFDSYGFPPDFEFYPSSIMTFLEDRSSKIWHHNNQLQNTLSTVCGHHCIFYLCHRACGLSLQQVLSKYTGDVIENDLMVSNFVKKYQKCVRNQSSTFFTHGTCSLEMFQDCYGI